MATDGAGTSPSRSVTPQRGPGGGRRRRPSGEPPPLAARHGIRVQLRHSWCGGITALVKLPQSLLVGSEAVIFPPGAGSARTGASGGNTRVHLPLRRHEPTRPHPPLPAPASGGATRTWPRGDA